MMNCNWICECLLYTQPIKANFIINTEQKQKKKKKLMDRQNTIM